MSGQNISSVLGQKLLEVGNRESVRCRAGRCWKEVVPTATSP